jgi:hypothetical protein
MDTDSIVIISLGALIVSSIWIISIFQHYKRSQKLDTQIDKKIKRKKKKR